MSNELEQKAKTLAQMLADNHLTKIASDQQIEHTSPEAQTGIGKEQTNEIKDEVEGVIASTDAAANKDKAEVETPPNNQNLNTDAKAALSNTGTSVEVMEQDGEKTSLKTAAETKTATITKTAEEYKHELAQMLANLRAQAMQKRAAAQAQGVDPENFRTGTEVMEKIASINQRIAEKGQQPSEAELNELHDDMLKLAASNPLFSICRDNILMRKMAEDIDALAQAEGMSPEDAAAQLDAAAAANPEMMQEAEDEANGEAVAQLADAEAGADDLMGGIQELADNASAVTGQDVTPDQILDAIDEVQAQADQMGVPAEALIQAALEEIQGGGGAEVTPDDEANAQAIMDEAAANGVSPDEVLQMAAGELDNGGGEAAPAESAAEPAAESAPAAEPAAEPSASEGESKSDDGGEKKEAESKSDDSGEKKDEGEKKDDGEKKEASFKQAATPRAAFVQQLLHAKK